MQGCAKSTVYLGAYDTDNKLISVMSFLRKNINCWELNRFASDDFIHAGLFSKMLRFFENNYDCKKVISFSDNRWSWGDVYRKNGFEVEKILNPDYFVTDYKIREHKFNWRKSRIQQRFGIDITDKTEIELTLELGRDRI